MPIQGEVEPDQDTEPWLCIGATWAPPWWRRRARTLGAVLGATGFVAALAVGVPPVACLVIAAAVNVIASCFAESAVGSRDEDYARITPEGIRPSRVHKVFVPRSAVAGVELRTWTIPGAVKDQRHVAVAVRLTDGRLAHLPTILRPLDPLGQPCRIRISTTKARVWRPMAGSDHVPLDWSTTNDALVLAELTELIGELMGGFAAAGAPCPAVKLRELADAGPDGALRETASLGTSQRWSGPPRSDDPALRSNQGPTATPERRL